MRELVPAHAFNFLETELAFRFAEQRARSLLEPFRIEWFSLPYDFQNIAKELDREIVVLLATEAENSAWKSASVSAASRRLKNLQEYRPAIELP